METLITLCTELSNDPESKDIGVMTNILQGILSHQVLKTVDDDALKKFIKTMNQLLNEPKTRPMGLLLLENFVLGVDSRQLVGLHDQITSTVQLLGKCLDFELAHKIVVDLLPLCQKVPELNQAAVSSILPRVFSKFTEIAAAEVPSYEEFLSVTACMEKYRGPSGVHRSHMEKSIIGLIDCEMDETIRLMYAKLWPLISGTSGGGNKGEKHTEEWHKMVMKLLKDTYDGLLYLLSDVCSFLPNENPLDAETQGLGLLSLTKNVKNINVLQRISKTAHRICTLSDIIGSYLSTPFPAPKSVPVQSILNVAYTMLLANPIAILKSDGGSTSTEITYLSCLLPQIMCRAFQMLRRLLCCIGSSVYPELSRLEFQILQQFKWINEASGDFESLKLEMYKTVSCLLRITRGSLSVQKNADTLATYLLSDITIGRRKVAISVNPKGKGKKTRNSGRFTLTPIEGNADAEYKSPAVCEEALKVLQLVIADTSAATYKTVYQTLVNTVSDFQRCAEFPVPYNLPNCRKEALNNLVNLALNPHHTSPVSVGLITSLTEYGCKDPSTDVSSTCAHLLLTIERIVHPTRPSLEFPPVAELSDVEMEEDGVTETDYIEETQIQPVPTPRKPPRKVTADVITHVTENSCLRVDAVSETVSLAHPSSSVSLEDLKETVALALKENLDEIVMRLQAANTNGSLNRRRHHSMDSDATIPKDQMINEYRASEPYGNGDDDYLSEVDSYEERRITQSSTQSKPDHLVLARDLKEFNDPDSDDEQIVVSTVIQDKDKDLQLIVKDILVEFDEDMILENVSV